MHKLINDIRDCFDLLIEHDGSLFECKTTDLNSEVERKLHEVCINHKLAKYLENIIVKNLGEDEFFVDIEFNKEGVNEKEVEKNGKNYLVRPDIIIHNRRSGENKKNFLIIECKKKGALKKDIKEDIEKIKDLMSDGRYQYQYGLQVTYSRDNVTGTLYFHENGNINELKI